MSQSPISDSGCTTSAVPLKSVSSDLEIIYDHEPSHISFANGTTTQSLGVTHLPLPGGKSLHTLVLKDQDLKEPLISLSQVCAQGFEVSLSSTALDLKVDGKVCATAPKDPQDRLWSFPLSAMSPSSADSTLTAPIPEPHTLDYVVSHQFNAETVAWFHAALGSPPITTFIRAVERGYLSGLPITTALIRKNPPASLATDQGHLQRRRQGLQSTKQLPTPTPSHPDDDVDVADDQMYFTVLPIEQAVYVDATGQLPWKYLLVSYRRVIC